MPSFLYWALDQDSLPQTGRVQAPTLAAARHKLEAQSYSQICFFTDEQSEQAAATHGHHFEGVTPEQELAARRERFGWKTLRKAYIDCSLLWLPPTLWAAWSLYAGRPYGFWDWLSFVLAALALLFPPWALAPALLYNRLQEAAAWKRGDEILRLCSATMRLRHVFPMGPLLLEARLYRAAVTAARGDLAGALAGVADLEQLLQPRTIYLSRLASIYTAARAWPQLAEAQAEAMELSQYNNSAVIDLATTLAWRLQRIEEAEALMQRIAGCELALLAQAYADFVNGLIARSRGQNGRAESLLRRSVEQLADFSDNPLTRLVIDLFNAERVITLAALGKTAKAAQLLRQVLPRLQAHGELETIRRCAAATLARPPG